MAAFEPKTIVRSYKLRIKNKYKGIVEETEKVISELQSCVSSFKDEVDTVANNNDEKFFSLYENLDNDFETYREKLFLLLASLDKNSEDEEITQIEEKQDEASNSNLQQELAPSLNKNSPQTFCKTIFSSNASEVTSASFFSVQDDFSMTQSNLPEIQNSIETAPGINFRHNNHQAQDTSNTEPKFVQNSHDHPESYLSSESSSYQSLSSGVITTSLSKTFNNPLESRCLDTSESEKCYSFGLNQDQYKQTQEIDRLTILHPLISVPSVIKATLSHIVSPYNFWMQLEDSKELSNFQTMEFGKKTSPLSVEPGDFCLALSNKVNMYYRAKVLTKTSVYERVEVLFIDFGSIQSVSIKNLRILPEAAYEIPTRAFHCSLSDILPVSGSWSAASIQKFKEYEGTCEVHVKSYSGGKYDIQLMIETFMGSIDVSEVLCEDGFAVYKEESSGSLPSSPLLADKTSIQKASHDSGVSITSNQRLSPCNQRLCFSSEMLHYNSSCISPEPTLQRKTYPQVELTEMDQKEDLISFESSEIMYTEISLETKVENGFATSSCLTTDDCDCPLHLLVLPPILHVVEEGRMLVMLSNIVSPSEFYVNLAMEDSTTLDELLEQMTAFYESHYQDYHIVVEDLKEGMFCAGRFYEDQSWYRIKILDVYFEDDNGTYVLVQYIDYGNKASIRCSDLCPLKPEFIQHPCFALKCSLAGIVPRVDTIEEEFSPWDKIAVETFHQLANFDRCLTAEIVENSISHLSSETVQVLLWDTEEAHDLLINEALVSRKVAEFDSSLVNNAQDQVVQQRKEEILNRWDPMEEEYEGIENSYGVDVDDVGIAISGYKPKDDSRVCRHFSLRNGYCPNGEKCPFEHVFLAEGGVTRDQEETYSLDPTPPLPARSSHVFVQVSAVINPGRFYAILPYGNKTPDDIDSLLNRGSPSESLENNEVRALFQELNDHYSNSPFAENTTVALSFGSIVVAWRSVDSAWHRARIIDLSDIAGPTQVFFVDFGDDSWVPRRKIREILPQYLHTPFQAIECHLSDIEPLGFEKGITWSIHSINYFKEVVSKAVLLAYITNRCGKVLHLTLRNTKQSDHDFISQSLIGAGFAQHCSLSTSKETESIYVPG